MKHFSESRTCEEAVAVHRQRVEDAIEYFEKYKDTGEFFVRECPFCGYDAYEEEEKFYGRYGVLRYYLAYRIDRAHHFAL